MKRLARPSILLAVGLAVALSATGAAMGVQAQTPAPPITSAAPNAPACQTAKARIAFDFEGASQSRCVVEGETEFTILITPEHAPPINPSPWYAFRYTTTGNDRVTINLSYLGGKHRYDPKWTPKSNSGVTRELVCTTNEDASRATMVVPPGEAIVSAQEMRVSDENERALRRWAAAPDARRIVLGQSHDGRAIEAVHLGKADAPNLIILLGRQHPPEVTGAFAMEAFVDQILALSAREARPLADYQLLIVPMLNPDGVARGHWRANLGGVDLNRDWGGFTQPETRAVKAWLDALPAGVRPVLMLDFHSTNRNVFYVQGDEATRAQTRFLKKWLGGKENLYPGYPFTLDPRNANTGAGTTKNWFAATYAIPAYTYEVADTADRAGTRTAAAGLADALPAALSVLKE